VTSLKRSVIRCWAVFLILVSLSNLVVGIAVFSLSTKDKRAQWSSMSKVDTGFFSDNFDNYQVDYWMNPELLQ
jgi:hypothetical protein